MRVGEICTRVPVTCTRETSLTEVAGMMREQHVGAVIVVDRDADARPRPVGVVTDRDLVVEIMAKGVDPLTFLAGDLLMGSLHLVNECDSIYDAVWQMRGHGVRRLPVVDDGGALVGVLTSDDVTRVLGEALSDIARTVPNQIRQERQLRP
ncbi:CBS domain-containing protein [Piscinibacter gummiphilus]|uniref:CBS domain-containing protein n=1 Tax=Piscinibacter gummiphilus TaxID=946333 RepID=A0ABZ0D5V9_9BURK|nr:CBS domain-containing protein [Piscinibacter gummiphilus]WOB10632.1 CBS domain-containing protein [Piscinibacter gummiphilus]